MISEVNEYISSDPLIVICKLPGCFAYRWCLDHITNSSDIVMYIYSICRHTSQPELKADDILLYNFLSVYTEMYIHLQCLLLTCLI